MKIPFGRIFGIFVMFAFITAASYQSLCAADIIHCAPCEKNGHENKSETACKSCEQSKDVASSVSLTKFSSHHDITEFNYTIVEELVFISPEFILRKPQEPPVGSIRTFTEDIISVTPIRGPSIAA